MSTVKYLKTDAASCYFFYIFVEKDVVGKMFWQHVMVAQLIFYA